MYLSELVGKRVINVKSASEEGIIIGAYVDRISYEANVLILDSLKALRLEDIYEVGEVVTTVEDNFESIDLNDYIAITTQKEVITVSGIRLGKVKDILLGKRGKRGEITADLSTFKVKHIVATSNNIITINPTYRKLEKETKEPIQEVLLMEAPSRATVENKAPPRATVENKAPLPSYDFLIGKKVKSEVSDINRSFVLMAGTLITERVIENARRAGKLSELVSRSK